MKNVIFIKTKKISKVFRFYLQIIIFILSTLTLLFKLFKLPGLSRVLSLFSLLPSNDALRMVEFTDKGQFIFPVFDYYYNMFFIRGRDYEPELLDLCKRIKVNYTFFDGGANLGYIASSFVHLSEFCTSLIAIEPNLSLRENLELNINNAIQSSNRADFQYKILNKAISDETKAQQFFKIGRHAGSSLSSNEGSVINGIYLDTISLNDLVENFSPNEVCFFKLDLEGAEFEALRPFKYFNKSIIIVEILDLFSQQHYIHNLCKEKNLNAFIFIDNWINLSSIKNINQIVKRKISNVGLNLVLIPQSLKDKVNVEKS